LLTQLRANGEKFLSVLSVSEPLDSVATLVAAPHRETKNNLSINRIAQQFPWRYLWRSRFSTKHSGLISAVRTGILGYVEATPVIGTLKLHLAWAAMPAFRGVAEGRHGIIAHGRLLSLGLAGFESVERMKELGLRVVKDRVRRSLAPRKVDAPPISPRIKATAHGR
jgi:hypothetical protein